MPKHICTVTHHLHQSLLFLPVSGRGIWKRKRPSVHEWSRGLWQRAQRGMRSTVGQAVQSLTSGIAGGQENARKSLAGVGASLKGAAVSLPQRVWPQAKLSGSFKARETTVDRAGTLGAADGDRPTATGSEGLPFPGQGGQGSAAGEEMSSREQSDTTAGSTRDKPTQDEPVGGKSYFKGPRARLQRLVGMGRAALPQRGAQGPQPNEAAPSSQKAESGWFGKIFGRRRQE